jgi:hypothetical protein
LNDPLQFEPLFLFKENRYGLTFREIVCLTQPNDSNRKREKSDEKNVVENIGINSRFV